MTLYDITSQEHAWLLFTIMNYGLILNKRRFQLATKMKQRIGFLFRPIREEHQQQQRSLGSNVARWVVLKLEKTLKVSPYI